MYTAVLMLAMTAGGDSMDHGRRNACHRSSGCYASCHGGCSGGYYRSGYYGNYYSPYATSGWYFNGSPNVIVQGPATDLRQSFYFDPNNQTGAMVHVLLPNPDAEVWFDNAPTQQRGFERMFMSPPLDPAGKYRYTIKTRWMENGTVVNRERNVDIVPGQPTTVDLRMNQGEPLPNPKTSEPIPKGRPEPRPKSSVDPNPKDRSEPIK